MKSKSIITGVLLFSLNIILAENDKKAIEKARFLIEAHRQQTPRWAILSKIQRPILLITGRYDAISVPEEMQDAHKLIANSKLEIIQNAAHESFLDQPEAFNAIILNHLRPQS